jgi:ribose-phosphate pyrophosphokinase
VTSRDVAMLLEAAGADRILAIDVHNGTVLQNAFRCPADHLEAARCSPVTLPTRWATSR